jgi:hypothetical protein
MLWRGSVRDSETAQLASELLEQLDTLGRDKGDLTFQLGLIAIGNIYLLEKIGSLKPDEYNGLQLVYIEHPAP